MIGVHRVRKPRGFDTQVKKVGDAWLAKNPNARRPKDLWSAYRAVLQDGFKGRCGYAAMLDPTGGTVDHFLSWKNHPQLAYEWSNFRFASQPLNRSKGTWDDSVLDPFEVQPGWFEILLPSLQLRMTNNVPHALRGKAEFTIKQLKLRDGETIIRWRRSWLSLYEKGRLDLDGLAEIAPLIADAVRRDSLRKAKS